MKEGKEKDNGQEDEKLKAIKEKRTCGFCAYRFPPDGPFALAQPPPQQRVMVSGQRPTVLIVAVVICDTTDSENFQRVMGLHGSCEHFKAVETAPATLKIANRFKDKQ